MKFKVKGLVFVGFAAAILSAGAYADDTNTVTSKAFTEATYQKLSNLTTQGDATGNVLGTGAGTDAKYPSEKAVASAIAASESATQYSGAGDTTVDNTTHTITTNVPVKIVQVNGTALTPGTNDEVNVTVASGTTAGSIAVNGTDVAVTNAEVTTNRVAQGTATGSVLTGNNVSDTLYPTTSAVVNAIAASESATQYSGAGDTTVDNTTHTITTNVPVKIVQVNGTALTPGTNDEVNVTVASGTTAGSIAVNGVDVAVTNAEVTTHKDSQGTATGSVLTNSDDNYPSSKAVINAISTAMGGYTLPTMAEACLASTAHCALVTSSDGTNVTMAWVPTAQ